MSIETRVRNTTSLSGGAGGGGGGSAQTPWLSDIDAAGFMLFNIGHITPLAGDSYSLGNGSGSDFLNGWIRNIYAGSFLDFDSTPMFDFSSGEVLMRSSLDMDSHQLTLGSGSYISNSSGVVSINTSDFLQTNGDFHASGLVYVNGSSVVAYDGGTPSFNTVNAGNFHNGSSGQVDWSSGSYITDHSGNLYLQGSSTTEIGGNLLVNNSIFLTVDGASDLGQAAKAFRVAYFHNSSHSTYLTLNDNGYSIDTFDGGSSFGPVRVGSIDQSGHINMALETASRALILDGSTNIVSSSTTSTELGYVSGVTSAIQTQLDSKPTKSFDRQTAKTAAQACATFTVPAADTSYIISANVLVTTATLFSISVTCTYTDEGNTSRTLTMNFSQLAGTFVTTMTNLLAAPVYEGVPLHIRCKASSTIVIASVGTFTTVTYNLERSIVQVS